MGLAKYLCSARLHVTGRMPVFLPGIQEGNGEQATFVRELISDKALTASDVISLQVPAGDAAILDVRLKAPYQDSSIYPAANRGDED